MKKIILMTGVIVVSLCLITAVGFTQQEVDPRGVCKADVEQFCKDVKPGQGRIWSCLKSHDAELSQACKDRMDQMREKGKAFGMACREDAKKFCKDVRPGQGRIVSCLKNHQGDLSESCKAFFNKN
jgi:hypothetical protein